MDKQKVQEKAEMYSEHIEGRLRDVVGSILVRFTDTLVLEDLADSGEIPEAQEMCLERIRERLHKEIESNPKLAPLLKMK